MSKLFCYQLGEHAPRLVPGRTERGWMDATRNRFAYRCLPLTIANSMGWELLLPIAFTAEWNGGPELADLAIEVDDPALLGLFAQSHFGHGILTLQTGYLFRTEPATALWVRGIPNAPKDGIAPLDGVVETDWLSFSFTMNWKFTRPGRVSFAAGEPFCFLTPIGYRALDDMVPEVRPLAAEPELAAAYRHYAQMRLDFNARLAANDPATLKQGWQKWYMRGERPDGRPGNPLHLSKLKLAEPRVSSPPATPQRPSRKKAAAKKGHKPRR